mmetsp:Transcript_66680/g.206461  ORF Transcript_66680/g.206461 Transcript_66680/m.206461 type:complete len:233 (-) Transcript_66680:1121-1819(-)
MRFPYSAIFRKRLHRDNARASLCASVSPQPSSLKASSSAAVMTSKKASAYVFSTKLWSAVPSVKTFIETSSEKASGVRGGLLRGLQVATMRSQLVQSSLSKPKSSRKLLLVTISPGTAPGYEALHVLATTPPSVLVPAPRPEYRVRNDALVGTAVSIHTLTPWCKYHTWTFRIPRVKEASSSSDLGFWCKEHQSMKRATSSRAVLLRSCWRTPCKTCTCSPPGSGCSSASQQ